MKDWAERVEKNGRAQNEGTERCVEGSDRPWRCSVWLRGRENKLEKMLIL